MNCVHCTSAVLSLRCSQVSAMPRPTTDSSRLNDVCAVCLAELDVINTKQTPCGHIYHEQCLVAWLKVGTNCPTCKQQLIRRHDSEQQQPVRQQLSTDEQRLQYQQQL